MAFTAFGLASVDHKIAIGKAIDSKQEIKVVLAEVAFGSFIPGYRANFVDLVVRLKNLLTNKSGKLSATSKKFHTALS